MSLKINKNGEWIATTPKAIYTQIIDLEGNFNSNNVEGALRELAEGLKNNANLDEMEQNVTNNKIAISNNKANINNITNKILDMENDIEWLKENGGGGGGNIVPTIKSDFQDCSIDKGSDVTIPIFFSAPSGGNGTAFISVNNIEVDNVTVKQGNNNIKVLAKHLTATENKISIYARDRAGLVSNQLTWTVIAGGITVTTTFDYEADYGITDSIIMPYNIETGINGDVTLFLTVDGTEYTIPCNNGYNQLDLGAYVSTLGTHSISMYATVDKYTSSKITFNLVITSTTELYLSTTFVDSTEFTYGVPININYRLSKKSTELFDVYIFLDDVLEKTQELTVGSYYYTLNKAAVGNHKVTIRVVSKDGSENKSIDMYFSIVKGEYIPIEDITDDLQLDLNAVGKSNEDNHGGYWKDASGNERHAKMINFNFSTNGFIENEVVCDNNAYIEIPYSPWDTNAKRGSTIDLIYTPINSGNEDARVIDYTFITDEMAEGEIKPFKGLFADIRQAIVSSSNSGASSGKISLDENSGQIHLTWVIDRQNKFCKTYINGILSRIMFLSDSGSGNNATFEDFSHTNYIYLNSNKGENCGTNNIKRLRVWGHALTSDEVLRTHLANIKDLEEQERLYNFNYNNTTLPRMDLYGDITNMTHEQTVDMRIQYTSPNEEKYGASFNTGIQNNPVKIQGTSSLQYVRKNYTIYLKDEYGSPMMYNPYGEGNAMPDSVFCLKADYIESSHGNNTGMANFVNDNVYDTKLPPQLENPSMRTTIAGFPIVVYMNGEYLGVYNFNHDRYSTESYGYDYKKYPNMLVYEINSNSNTSAGAFYRYGDNAESSANINERDYYARDFGLIYGNRTSSNDTYAEIKSLVEWVSVAEQDLFRETISEHFNKEYLFRYLLTVLMIGGVDSLGKNMKITTFDGKVWYPTFYDMDTCLGIDNSGYLTIEPDVEIEEGSFNTSNSNLWTKVMNFFAAELKEEWALMRQGRFTLDNLLKYVVENQIEVIPAKFYNDDAQVKYLDFGSLYTYCCHGSKEHLVKRWLRERIAYVDSMMGYFTSQDDQVTIRMNKTGYVEFSVTPYIPLYFSVKWSNADGGVQTFKLKRGETKTFYYTSTTATDQEVIIYHAQYIKDLDGLSNLRPSSCILANATKLNNVEIHSDELYNINVSNNKYLRKLDLSGCSTLGTVTATGSVLDVSECKYLNYLNIYGTSLTGVLLNTSGGSLKEIYYPKTIQEVQLIRQTLLEKVGLPYGNNGNEIPTSLYTIDIQECPSIKTLNTSSNEAIAKTWISMKYCQNLTIRNALDFERITLDGFQRLKVLKLENMFKLKSLGFDDMLSVGESSTLKYMGVSYCPSLLDITMNCTSNDYEITFANGALLNLSGATNLNSLSSNCIIKGLETIVVPLNLKHLYFTNEYGTGFSSIKNIWSSRCCDVNMEGVLPVAIRYEDKDFVGIDLQGMKMKDIDLGALVNVPQAINFDLSPTSVNPNFNINRDGIEIPYLQPVGILDLTNYTESLAKFFNGVDLDKLQLVCNGTLPQTDLSYCFYNSTFSDDSLLSPILSNLGEVNILDYCFYKTSISGVNILNSITYKNCSMNYAFGECSNIKSLNNITIPDTVISADGLFTKCPITTINKVNINVTDSVANIFKDCVSLTTVTNLNMPNAKSVSGAFEGCVGLTGMVFTSITDNVQNISRMYYNCTGINNIDEMTFGAGITNITDWINKEQIISANNVIIKNSSVNFNGWSNLQKCENLLITSNVKSMANYFKDCVSLDTITFNSASDFSSVSSMAYLFNNCTSLSSISVNIPDRVTNIDYMFNGCNLITNISNMTFGEGVTSSINWYPPNLQTANNLIIKNDTMNFKGNKTLQYIKNLDRPNSTEWTSYFENCTSLKEDILIPLNATDVTNMFKGCTSMTHIHSNWDNNYESEIIATDCYNGCTGITHIDDVNVIIYEGKEGLDEIPLKWGGYEFSQKDTTVLRVEVPSDNYTLYLTGVNWSTTLSTISVWGDGTIDYSNYHTYEKAGTYVIKTKFEAFDTTSANATLKTCKTDILQLKKYIDNTIHFRECNFGYVNIDNCIVTGSRVFYSCKVEEISAKNLTIRKNGILVPSPWIYSSTSTISGTETWNVSEATNLSNIFNGLGGVTSLDLTGWEVSNVTTMAYMFNDCRSLKNLDLKNWKTKNVTNMGAMFQNCNALTSVEFFNNWDLSGVTHLWGIFCGLHSVSHSIDFSTLDKSRKYPLDFMLLEAGFTEVTGLTGLMPSGGLAKAFMKSGIEKLDVSDWNWSEANAAGALADAWCGFVYQNPNLTELNLSNIKSAKPYWGYLGMNCPKLKKITVNGTIDSPCNSVYRIFENCTELEEVDFSTLDMATCTDATSWSRMLIGCSKLVHFKAPKNIQCSFDFYSSNLVTVESLMSLINNLLRVSSTKTLKIGAVNLAKLSTAQIKVATDKGWTVVA